MQNMYLDEYKEFLKSYKTISSKKAALTRRLKKVNAHLSDLQSAFYGCGWLHGYQVTSLQISDVQDEQIAILSLRKSL